MLKTMAKTWISSYSASSRTLLFAKIVQRFRFANTQKLSDPVALFEKHGLTVQTVGTIHGIIEQLPDMLVNREQHFLFRPLALIRRSHMLVMIHSVVPLRSDSVCAP
jgi:hypothetical protein